MTYKRPHTPADPLLSLDRLSRLGVQRAWFEETVYGRDDALDLYPLKDDDELLVRVPTARIITNRHLGLEINRAPEFKLGNEAAQKWLTRILKLNGVRGTMRAAATTKSWAGDVGLLFAFKPTEKDIFGTAWQIGFIEPETYDVRSRYPSGVFREVDIYSFVDEWDAERRENRRWWKRTRYSREWLVTWPRVEGVVGDAARPSAAEFDTAAEREPDAARRDVNTLGVIPFVVIQNVSGGPQDWEGVSDYQHLTFLFHRINIALNTLEIGEQIRNRLMMALIDAEEVDVKLASGLTVLDVKSNQDGTDDRSAQVMPAPLTGIGNGQSDSLTRLMDFTLEAAGVAQTGSAKELFGNEAASSSALKTFYSLQTAVAQHKRENWLGERADFGLSAFVRKLLRAARRVDWLSTGLPDDTDLDDEQFELTLDWPEMFALSAPERQTEASVAQQANDDGLPPEIVARRWGRVLDATTPREQRDITEAIRKRQAQITAGMLEPTPPKRGILGSGQGDGLGVDGGSVTATVVPK